ncbi:ATP-dependent DNA helicase Q-like 5 [Achlya hypogyna]|uniref:DNA 3'-5' helicase n=1 Tax=Achlya hypogyna TaxID=1202772 RepID=A0A1V9YB71_ACHHY|nr:ATP-dependent DNA helicase Q-like 5 [Achlya hypogyna]
MSTPWPRRGAPATTPSTEAPATGAWPRRKKEDVSEAAPVKTKLPPGATSWPRRKPAESLATATTTKKKEVQDDAWVLKMYEKRKELKKKRKLEAKTAPPPAEVPPPVADSAPVVEEAAPPIARELLVMDEVFPPSLTKPCVDDIMLPDPSSSLPPEPKRAKVSQPAAKPRESIGASKPTPRAKRSVNRYNDDSESCDDQATSPPQAPTKKKVPSKTTAPPSDDDDPDEVDTSAWRKHAIKARQQAVGTHAVSDNFVRLTMRKKVKGSRGNPKKRPLYMRATLYDKAEHEEAPVSKATHDGVDVVQECLSELAKPPPPPTFVTLEEALPTPLCYHGIPAHRLVVKKKTANHGRAFYACTRKLDEGRCDYFLWEENHPDAIAHALATPEAELPPMPAFESPLEALRVLFGHADFKPGQAWAIDRVLKAQAKASLLILPTGAGKSLCYQLPAVFLPGLTLVISPLISLINDQMEKLPPPLQARAASFSSAKFKADQASLCRALYAGHIKLLFVSPERAVTAGFHALLQKLTISLVCVDEAHCLSEWSHNFRPSFLRLGPLAAKASQVLALTATASNSVMTDIMRILSIPEDGVRRDRVARANLVLHVAPTTDAARLDDLRALLSAPPYNKGSVIVYVHTQYAAAQVAGHLSAQAQIKTSAYHAGLEADVKEKVRTTFLSGKLRVVVATIAFGMGIDKPNVRGVIHYHMPSSMEHYVQHIGRAGRDGKPAHCTLLLVATDFNRFHALAHSDGLALAQVQRFVRLIFESEEAIATRPGLCELTLPLKWLEVELDMKEGVLETILTMLELQGRLRLLPSLHATCTLTISNFEPWKKDPLFGRVEALADVATEQEGYLTKTVYTFNVVALTQTFPLRANDDIVLLELRRLQQQGLGQYTLSDYAVRLERSAAPVADLDRVVQDVYWHHCAQEKCNVTRVEALYGALLRAADAGDTTAALNETIHDYFEDEALAPAKPWAFEPLTPGQVAGIQQTTQSLLNHDARAFSTQSITRILHGMASPCFPSDEWRDHTAWSRYAALPFPLVKDVVHDVVTAHRKAQLPAAT